MKESVKIFLKIILLISLIIFIILLYQDSVRTGINTLQKAGCRDFTIIENYIRTAVLFVSLLIISLAGNCFYLLRDLHKLEKL